MGDDNRANGCFTCCGFVIAFIAITLIIAGSTTLNAGNDRDTHVQKWRDSISQYSDVTVDLLKRSNGTVAGVPVTGVFQAVNVSSHEPDPESLPKNVRSYILRADEVPIAFSATSELAVVLNITTASSPTNITTRRSLFSITAPVRTRETKVPCRTKNGCYLADLEAGCEGVYQSIVAEPYNRICSFNRICGTCTSYLEQICKTMSYTSTSGWQLGAPADEEASSSSSTATTDASLVGCGYGLRAGYVYGKDQTLTTIKVVLRAHNDPYVQLSLLTAGANYFQIPAEEQKKAGTLLLVVGCSMLGAVIVPLVCYALFRYYQERETDRIIQDMTRQTDDAEGDSMGGSDEQQYGGGDDPATPTEPHQHGAGAYPPSPVVGFYPSAASGAIPMAMPGTAFGHGIVAGTVVGETNVAVGVPPSGYTSD